MVLLYAHASLDISFCIPATSPGTGRTNAAATATAVGSKSFRLASQSGDKAQGILLCPYLGKSIRAGRIHPMTQTPW